MASNHMTVAGLQALLTTHRAGQGLPGGGSAKPSRSRLVALVEALLSEYPDTLQQLEYRDSFFKVKYQAKYKSLLLNDGVKESRSNSEHDDFPYESHGAVPSRDASTEESPENSLDNLLIQAVGPEGSGPVRGAAKRSGSEEDWTPSGPYTSSGSKRKSKRSARIKNKSCSAKDPNVPSFDHRRLGPLDPNLEFSSAPILVTGDQSLSNEMVSALCTVPQDIAFSNGYQSLQTSPVVEFCGTTPDALPGADDLYAPTAYYDLPLPAGCHYEDKFQQAGASGVDLLYSDFTTEVTLLGEYLHYY